MKNDLFVIVLCIIVGVCTSCSSNNKTENNDEKYIKAWKSIYDSERNTFLGDDTTYKALKYFSKPFKEFEQNMDKLERDYFSGNKEVLINDVYKSLPKDYFLWDKESVSAFFENVEDKQELEIRGMSFRTLVLHRLSYAYRSATYEVNAIRPVFIKGDNESNDVYGKFILEAHNYLSPMFVTVAGDTLPYMKDFEDVPFISQKMYENFANKGIIEAKVYYISWGDTNSYDVEFR